MPFLSLSLSSRWLTLITPLYAGVGRCLIESVRTPSVVRDSAAWDVFSVRPMGICQAIERALTNEQKPFSETRWSDARAHTVPAAEAVPGSRVLTSAHSIRVPVSANLAFAPIRRIGGRTGWYFGNTLWRVPA